MYIGIDMVKISRIKMNNESFMHKVFNEKELRLLEKDFKNKEFVAGRFALKEAIIKTFEGKKEVLMNEIIILKDQNDCPLCTYQDYVIKGSISHEDGYAIAVAIRME